MTSEKSAAATDHKRLVTVTDGSADAQAWVDALVAAARDTIGNWPHPHTDIPRQQITIAKLWSAIEGSFAADGNPWSIARLGFPILPNLSWPGGRKPDPDPNTGSIVHNAMHAAFGDFH